jgi:predicted PurR-regulated permease PerM
MLAVVRAFQQVEINLLTSTIQRRAVNVSEFIIIVAVALLGMLTGLLAAIVAVLLAATIQIVVPALTAARRAEVAASKAGVAVTS